MAAMVVGGCLVAYLSSGQSQPGNDTTASVHQAVQLIDHGSTFFTPEQNPKMFTFSADQPGGRRTAKIRDWSAVTYQGRPALEAYTAGLLRVEDCHYYLVPTRHAGRYANTFGLGAGLFAAPLILPARLLVRDLASRVELLWWLAKLAAALSVAGTVLVLYLAACRHFSVRAAALLALTYGIGTSAYSVSSQALWQHGPCELFVALGAYFLLAKDRRRSDVLCGAAFALATVCRPTAALVVLCVALHLLIDDRRRLLWYLVGGIPVAVALAVYSQYSFGSLFSVGQMRVAADIARLKTGQPDVWQTPLWEGMAGLLVSPARGLFVYTPLALLACWGTGRAFRNSAWRDLRPLAVAAVLSTMVAAKRFDWWGGWCFGYRPIVDVAILLAFLSLPVVESIASSRRWQAVWATLFAYSFAVQLMGAFVYDVAGWNGRTVWDVDPPGTTARLSFDDEATANRYVREKGGQVKAHDLSVDRPENRGRLWSLTDSPLLYYLGDLSRSAELRSIRTAQFLSDDG